MRSTLALLALCLSGAAAGAVAAPVEGYEVVGRLPHDPHSFTEGFFFRDGLFYEGLGWVGQSGVVAVEPKTGKVVRRVDLPPPYFGEGIVDVGSQLYEWTWQGGVGFVYDLATFKRLREFHYGGEGWGMTRAGGQIVTSDGSPVLRFRDPASFSEVREITVTDDGVPVLNLNELEYVKGEILANVWKSDRIARISPKDGRVIAWIDLSGLRPSENRGDPDAVLNGIAYDAAHDRLFVTGKRWSTVFEIRPKP